MNQASFLLPVALLAAFTATAADPAVTIYNQNFGVVRETLPLDLKPGLNTVSFAEATAHVEPQSVTLRDPAGKIALQILEQNYRNDPVSQALLLSVYEGKTINFRVRRTDKDEIVPGKIIRSGYAMHNAQAMQRYGRQYYQSQAAMGYAEGGGQPLIEVNGELQFGLPGEPRFPTLPDDSILKPTLTWKIESGDAVKLDAELAYISGGLSWEADYNVIAPEKGDTLDLSGWVTMDNQSGRTFTNARIKLMAGDVNRIADDPNQTIGFSNRAMAAAAAPPVSEKTFDEYHLYTLERPATLRDRETKQVEFVRADGVQSQRLYIYDGAKIDQNQFRGYNAFTLRMNEEYGTQSNPKVWVMQEFKNSAANHLGIPLPRGSVRFYRRDADGRLEFTGENLIDHTAKDETIRIYTGNAFDLTGERRRTTFKIDDRRRSWADESFEIKLRNHKTEPVEIRVVERLYRGVNWEITEKSNVFLKTEAQTIEFRLALQPDEEKTLTYTAHYTW